MEDSSGIQPVMTMNPTNSSMFGNEGIWLFAILALMWGGGGLFGNRGGNDFMTDRPATANDVTQASNFAALERQNNEGVAATRQIGYDLQSAIKDANYNTLSELRDLQAAVADGNARSQACCCAIQKEILTNRYESALNTSSINSNTTAGIQKILDAISTNRIADMQNQINQLQLQNAMSGVVRYPNAWAYNAGVSPFCAGNYGCGNGNI